MPSVPRRPRPASPPWPSGGYREVTETEVARPTPSRRSPRAARGLAGATSVQAMVIRTDRPEDAGWSPAAAPYH